MPAKPIRFGFKFYSLATTRGYLWNYDLYLGKHYQPGLKIDSVVKNLIVGLENSYRHVFMDNFYNTI